MGSESRRRNGGVSRRGFLDGIGGAAALSGVATAETQSARSFAAKPVVKTGLTAGVALRVKPVLVWQLAVKKEQTSWRGYGGLVTRQDVDAELKRLSRELSELKAAAEFPLEILPVGSVNSAEEAGRAKQGEFDAMLIYASAGPVGWYEALISSGKPSVMYLREKSGPFYLYYEIAHFRFLRKSDDKVNEPNMDVDDVVVDEYDDVLWRLRALYGLKNAKGTRCLAVGGLTAYTKTGQRVGPDHVRQVWGYEIVPVGEDEFAARVAAAREDSKLMAEIRQRTDKFLAQPNLALATEKRFVVNSILAIHVIKQMMQETRTTNLGIAQCMGSAIKKLDTPPCLIFSMLNDEGLTAFCHTDYTHTAPGVLLRWISGKPSFVSNSHYPHHGRMTLAHCATPRRMSGRDYEPSRIVTHFESDYGAATRVEFRKGQVITNLIPNFACTKWYGFRGTIVDTPNYPACRSQIDMKVDGDWRKLLTDLEGFHTVTCYGDYLREVGYALKKVGLHWANVSEKA